MWLHTFSREQREVLFRLAHNVIVSDGLLDPNEEGMLEEFRREMDIDPTLEPEYVELAGLEQIFDSQRARSVAMLNLIKLSYADGAFEIEEECLLREVGKVFGVTDQQFMLLDNWVRRMISLEQEAQAFM